MRETTLSKTKMKTCPYHTYYSTQAGNGIGTVYRGAPYQRGHGIGSFLGGLFKSIMPLIRGGLHTLGQEVFSTGHHVMHDMHQNVPVKEAMRTRLIEAGKNLKRKASDKLERMMGAGSSSIKRVREQSNKRSLKAKHHLKKVRGARKTSSDIFH